MGEEVGSKKMLLNGSLYNCQIPYKNKDSMEKREQIIELLNKCIIGESVANTADAILALFGVSNSLDLRELERKLDEALGKETRETLTEWIKQQRR